MWLEAVPVITVFVFAGLLHKSHEPKEETKEILLSDYKLVPDTFSNFVSNLIAMSQKKKTNHIITLNPEMAVESFNNKALQNTLKQADFVTADGVGILAAVQYQRLNKQKNKLFYWLLSPFYWTYTFYQLFFTPDKLNPHLFRITGSDLVKSILEEGNDKKLRLAILGSTSQIIKEARINIEKKYPNLRLVFADCGPQRIESDGSVAEHEIRKLSSTINHSQPNILLVAFGVPKQELFLNKYKHLLNVPVSIGVSGAFDTVLANRIKRAPKIFRVLQIEWLWRLIKQPSRLKRIYTATIKFPFLHSKNIIY